jgi:hypothetical protein
MAVTVRSDAEVEVFVPAKPLLDRSEPGVAVETISLR